MKTLGWVAFALALSACGGSSDAASEPIVLDEASNGHEASDSAGDGAGDEAETPPEAPGRLVVGDDACSSDADCVPADCCHAAACVGRASAPACGDAVCTTECRYGTIDCGGGCLCHEGRCAARLSEAPEMSVQ